MKSLWTGFAAIGLFSALASCGGADSHLFDDPAGTVDSGGGGDTSNLDGSGLPDTGIKPPDSGPGPTDTAIDTAPPPGITLDNVCDRLADVVCTDSLKSCCATHGVEFKGSACKDSVHFDCSETVAEVKAGTAKFDPTKFEKCALAWKTMNAACSVPILDWLKYAGVCNEVFVGSTPPGGACTRDAQCTAPAGAWGNCLSSGTCLVEMIVGKDASCNYSGTTVRYCDYGLYCATSGGPGVCRVAKKIGDSCGGAWDASCGFGNSCRELKCQVGAAKGMSCGGGAADLQCASWSCDGGMCTDPYVQLAIPLLCSGAAG